MKSSLLYRRIHLYLGLALAPWVLMYGLSSLPFAHPAYFQQRDQATGLPLWTQRFQQPYSEPIPQETENLRAFGRNLLRELGIEAPNVGVSRMNAQTVTVQAFSFLKSTRMIYRADRQMATVEDRRFRFDQFLTGMHARGGYRQEGFLQVAWSVVVDVVALSMLAWIATGLYLWWRIAGHRLLGGIAILAGGVTFLAFALML